MARWPEEARAEENEQKSVCSVCAVVCAVDFGAGILRKRGRARAKKLINLLSQKTIINFSARTRPTARSVDSRSHCNGCVSKPHTHTHIHTNPPAGRSEFALPPNGWEPTTDKRSITKSFPAKAGKIETRAGCTSSYSGQRNKYCSSPPSSVLAFLLRMKLLTRFSDSPKKLVHFKFICRLPAEKLECLSK